MPATIITLMYRCPGDRIGWECTYECKGAVTQTQINRLRRRGFCFSLAEARERFIKPPKKKAKITVKNTKSQSKYKDKDKSNE